MDGKPGKPELVIFILSPDFLVFPFFQLCNLFHQTI